MEAQKKIIKFQDYVSNVDGAHNKQQSFFTKIFKFIDRKKLQTTNFVQIFQFLQKLLKDIENNPFGTKISLVKWAYSDLKNMEQNFMNML